MTTFKVGRITLLAFVVVALTSTSAPAAEGYKYQGSTGFATSFYLIGGQYVLYANAALPAVQRFSSATGSCTFAGAFEREWPTKDAMQLGGAVRISTVAYRIQPVLNLVPGLYRFSVAPLSDCQWDFVLVSTSLNPAGIAEVQMFKKTAGGYESSSTASLTDKVQFYTHYRTEHDVKAQTSGTSQILHDDKVVATFPLQVGKDDGTRADILFQNIYREPSDAKYLGKNAARFVVKIGSAEFSSTAEFTLTK